MVRGGQGHVRVEVRVAGVRWAPGKFVAEVVVVLGVRVAVVVVEGGGRTLGIGRRW